MPAAASRDQAMRGLADGVREPRGALIYTKAPASRTGAVARPESVTTTALGQPLHTFSRSDGCVTAGAARAGWAMARAGMCGPVLWLPAGRIPGVMPLGLERCLGMGSPPSAHPYGRGPTPYSRHWA